MVWSFGVNAVWGRTVRPGHFPNERQGQSIVDVRKGVWKKHILLEKDIQFYKGFPGSLITSILQTYSIRHFIDITKMWGRMCRHRTKSRGREQFLLPLRRKVARATGLIPNPVLKPPPVWISSGLISDTKFPEFSLYCCFCQYGVWDYFSCRHR